MVENPISPRAFRVGSERLSSLKGFRPWTLGLATGAGTRASEAMDEIYSVLRAVRVRGGQSNGMVRESNGMVRERDEEPVEGNE